MGGGSMHRPLTQKARALRRRQTDAEIKLWRYLKDLNRAGHTFRHQAPIGPYIVDFANHSRKLVIELDGSQHGRPRELREDAERDAWLSREGYHVLRFWNSDVLLNTEGVVDSVLQTLRETRGDQNEFAGDDERSVSETTP